MKHVFSGTSGLAVRTVCCAVLLCCFLLAGCGKTVISRPVPKPATPSAPSGDQVRISVPEAENALRAGQTARAEQIATRLVSRTDLSRDELVRASRVLAVAASANGHPFLAMTALDRWLGASPGADASDEWQQPFLTALGQLPHYDAQAKAAQIMANQARPFTLRSGTALFLASARWEKGEPAQALTSLSAFYAQAGDKAGQVHMEHALLAALQSTNSPILASLDRLVTDENSKTYPYAIVRLESLRRMGLHGTTLAEAKQGAELLAQDTMLADPAILRSWDSRAGSETTLVPLAGKKIVLALPLSGPVGGVGKKIAQGADEARNEFARSGHAVSVITLDTNAPDWLDRLAALPPDATLVGGPLQMDAFAAARSRGLTGQRAFFTFLPSIGDAGDEGEAGWRFFPSNEDQLTALFAATSRLGITSYAVLIPDHDPYAARMADMFAAHARAGGGNVVRRAEYPRNEPEKWNTFIGNFLHTNKKSTGKPATPHQAIFLPDSWRNMELIVPNLFYFLETRQVLLGTTIWGQGLSAADKVAAHYYRLAIFPGAWNKATPSQAAEQLFAAYARAGRGEPDFWAGLGYDFVRFAAVLDVPVGWTPASLNALLSRGAGMHWSMAPITWSASGKASQSLFLFTPTENGFAPADLNAIEAVFKKEWGR